MGEGSVRIYDAAEAEKIGYASKVFPEGELLESVHRIDKEMSAYDRGCNHIYRKLVREEYKRYLEKHSG